MLLLLLGLLVPLLLLVVLVPVLLLPVLIMTLLPLLLRGLFVVFVFAVFCMPVLLLRLPLLLVVTIAFELFVPPDNCSGLEECWYLKGGENVATTESPAPVRARHG
jgi:hypothetical protein